MRIRVVQQPQKCFWHTYFCAMRVNVKRIHEKYALKTLNIIFSKIDNMYYLKKNILLKFMINKVKREIYTKLKRV